MAEKNSDRMDKKGTIQDFLVIGIILLIFSVVVLVTFKVSNELNTKFQDSALINSKGKSTFNQINNMYSGVIDNSFLFLMIALTIFAFVMAAMVRIHPIFIMIFLLVLVFIIFLCGIFSNIYQEMAGQAEMIAIADQLTFITLIMNTLPFIVSILGGGLAIVMFKAWQGASY